MPAAADRRPNARAVLAVIVGLVGAGTFGLYVTGTGLGLWPRGTPMSGPTPWLVSATALLLFALQHSGMARPAAKRWASRPTYVAASGLALVLLVAVWQPLPGDGLWHGPPWTSGISLLGAAFIAWCAWRYDPGRFLGLDEGGEDAFRVDGPYRWVRHPLMIGLLVYLWGQTHMPPELFALNVGLTAYILVAIRWEERDLGRRFGDAYITYRDHVPALVPWRGPYVPGPEKP